MSSKSWFNGSDWGMDIKNIMLNKYCIKVNKAIYILETYITLNDSKEGTLSFVKEIEAELEDSEILEEWEVGVIVPKPEIIDFSVDKAHY